MAVMLSGAKHLCSLLWAVGRKRTAVILRFALDRTVQGFAQDDSHLVFTIYYSPFAIHNSATIACRAAALPVRIQSEIPIPE
jgi:hypothetical protein